MNDLEAAVWMRRFAELSRGENSLPDPALIWWKARLLERQAARARVCSPVLIVQWISVVVAVLASVGLSILYWPGIRGMLEPFSTLALVLAVASSGILAALALRFAFGD